jgi:hypothetical protein
MRFNILGDIEWESKLDSVLDWLTSCEYRDFFQARDYGDGLSGISAFLICRKPELNFKRRIRFSRNEKKIYLDIMFDYSATVAATADERRMKVLEELLREVPAVIRKYKIPNFDADRFLSDFAETFEGYKG